MPTHFVNWLPTDQLTTHPRNYNAHPDEQIRELAQSIQEHGFFRAIVIANDAANTVLAGEGILRAAQLLNLTQVPFVRMPYAPEDVRALKVMAADNELARLSHPGVEALQAIIDDIRSTDDLFGTGLSDEVLTALAADAKSAYTPNLAPTTSYAPVDSAALARARRDLERKFSAEDALRPIVCPHCAGEFYVE